MAWVGLHVSLMGWGEEGQGDGEGADECGKLKELKSLATSSVQHVVLDVEYL